MLSPCSPEQYAALQREELMRFPLIAAVLEGRQSGHVYADITVAPETVFVAHKSGFCALHTSHPRADYQALLDGIAARPELPQYIHQYDAPSGLIEYVAGREPYFGLKIRERVQLQYALDSIDAESAKPSIPVTAHPITEGTIRGLESLGLDLEQKFWNSADHFLAGGYGVFLELEGVGPVAVCYAAGVGAGHAEVDILTLEAYKRRGLAKYAAALFVQQCLDRGIRANWDCFTENVGSLQTAHALGFENIHQYIFLSLFFKQKLGTTANTPGVLQMRFAPRRGE